MTKSELIARLAARNPHLYQRDVERIVATVFDEISKALAGGDRVELRGFGAFSVKKREPRTGRNPRTGEQVAVASKRVPYFKTGKDLRDRLNKEAQRIAGAASGEPAGDKEYLLAFVDLGTCVVPCWHRMKILLRAVFVLFVLVGMLVAVSNSQLVELALWPLPHLLVMPVYLLVVGTLLLGILAGLALGWWGGRHHRRRARERGSEAARLEREVLRLREAVAANRPVPAGGAMGAAGAREQKAIERQSALVAPELLPPTARSPSA